MSARRSLVPISTRSTPSTAAISSALSIASAVSNCTTTMVASFIAAFASAAGNERYCRCGSAPPIERPRDVLGPGARHAHEGRDADLERGDADLAGRLQRQARMLDVHIDGIEAGRFRDARDLDRAHQAHRDRRDNLAARELLFYVVAHDLPRRCGHGVLPGDGPLLYASIPAHTPRSPPMNNLVALAGRFLLALIFLLSGIDKVVHYAGTLGYMTKAGLPFPQVLLIVSIIVEIGAALAIIAGWKTH